MTSIRTSRAGVTAILAAFILFGVFGSSASAVLDLTKLPPLLPLPSPTPPPPPPPPAPGAGPVKAGAVPAGAVPVPVGPEVACGPAPVPPKLKRSPARNTSRLIEHVAPLVQRGISLGQAMVLVAPPFPVAGKANFSDDWLNPRTTPCPHLHHGTDIFADFGTPIVTSGPGTLLSMGRQPVGGLAMWVAGDDGNKFYYAHLQKFANGLKPGQRLEQGTVLGEVGDSGNAEGGAPHLHFQFHPRRGGTVAGGAANPKPFLDVLLAQAEERAPGLVAELLNSTGPLPQPPVPQIVIGSPQGGWQTLFSLDGAGSAPAGSRSVANAALMLGILSLLTMIWTLGATAKLRWWNSYEEAKKAAANGKTLPASTSRFRPGKPRHQLI